MNDDIRPNPNPGAVPAFADQLRHSKALLPTLAVLLVAVVALAAALVFGRSQAQPGAAVAPMTGLAAQQPQAAGLAPAGAPGVVPGTIAGQTAQAADSTAPAQGTAGAVEGAPGRDYAPPVVTAPRQTSRPVARTTGAPHRTAPAAAVQAERAPVCATCGTVESVTPIEHSAPTSGVGAIAGGVVGGLVGNQFGGGNGRAAMTVLGAVGGGFAGNAIEKRVKTTTVYRMRIRMEDGRTRTVEQAAAIAVGRPVVVEGNSARAVAPGSAVADPSGAAAAGRLSRSAAPVRHRVT